MTAKILYHDDGAIYRVQEVVITPELLADEKAIAAMLRHWLEEYGTVAVRVLKHTPISPAPSPGSSGCVSTARQIDVPGDQPSPITEQLSPEFMAHSHEGEGPVVVAELCPTCGRDMFADY